MKRCCNGFWLKALARRSLCKSLLKLIAATLLTASQVSAQTVGQYQLEAALLFNLLKFVEFKDPPQQKFELCAIGVKEALLSFQALEGKKVSESKLEMRYFHSKPEPKFLLSCRTIFFSNSFPAAQELLAALEGSPVLTVGASETFLDAGGVVNFFVENSRMRFEVAIDRAREKGLAISSRALSLAKIRSIKENA